MIDFLLMWVLMNVDTGGGIGVGGNLGAQDFTGRDTADHRNYIDIDLGDNRSRRNSQSLEDRVLDLERLIYGESRWNEPGMIKRQQRQLQISQTNLGLNVAGLVVIVLLLFQLWGGR